MIDDMLGRDQTATAESVVETATEALAQLTGCATFNTKNMPQISVITRVEVIPAGRRLYALLILTSSGAIKNRICRMEFDLSDEQLAFFDKFLNENLHGLKVDQLNPSMMQNLAAAMGSYMMTLTPLLYAVYELSSEFTASNVNLRGKPNYLRAVSLTRTRCCASSPIRMICRRCFPRYSTASMWCLAKRPTPLPLPTPASSCQSIILAASMRVRLASSALVRLDYAKMIPYIQYFSDSVTRMLSGSEELLEEGEQHERKEEKRIRLWKKQ